MEFKRLSDVEVVAEPSESANVLIEENGVIKKAPKSTVGGAGAGESDLVINIDAEPFSAITADNFSFSEGSIDNVLVALSEKRIPIVKLRFFKEAQTDYSYYATELMANVYRYGSELYFSYIHPNTYNGVIFNGYVRFTTDGVFEVNHVYSTNTTEMI